MPDRFHVPGPWSMVDSIELPESEAQHIARVLRMQVEQTIEIFDGAGNAARATLTEVARKRVCARVLGPVEHQSPAPQRLTLAVAPPKGDRFRSMLEKLTELGVDCVVPLRTARSVVDPRDSKLDKLELNIIAACKQCGRNRLLNLTRVRRLEELLSESSGQTLLFGADSGTPARDVQAVASKTDTLIIVGPEGGLTSEETTLLMAHGAQPVRSGQHTLRIETAAIALAASFR